LAIVTIGLLTEMGFRVDLASFNKPNLEQLKRDFGDIVNSVEINSVPLDLFSVLDLSGTGDKSTLNAYSNDSEYDLIINTHGDLLPYYGQSNDKKKVITYCHFPVLPQLVYGNQDLGYMRFVRRWTRMENMKADLEQKVLENASRTYDLMINNTTVLTNSNFSKKAIEKRYGPAVNPVVIYPPVDVHKFRSIVLHTGNRGDMILVVSRFSPDKQLENVIEIFKLLVRDIKIEAKAVLVGNIAAGDGRYLEELKRSIRDYDLESKIDIKVNASFDQLLDLMRKSKVYLHPLAGEPFGISIVEAASAGLIPVVPDEGGYTEFVPDYYQFHTHRQAADIIGKILIASDNDMQAERSQLSESVLKFSAGSYKASLRKVIESVLSSSKTSLPA